jgi:hypothetical protein
MPIRLPGIRIALAIAAIVAIASLTILIAYRIPGIPADWQGLRVSVYDGTGPGASLLEQGVDRSVFTGAVDQRVKLGRGRPFAVEWQGFLAVDDAGPQCFWTLSDDGSWLWIDDTLVVDNGGVHAPARVKGCVDLARGLHAIRIRFTEEGGTSTLDILWRQPSGRWVPFSREPDELVQQRLGWSAYRAVRLRAGLLKGIFVLWTVALASLVVWALARLVWRVAVRGLPPRAPSRLAGVLALLVPLAVWGIWWGLPAYIHWAPDELAPHKILPALERVFSNGWYDFYPPLQYMLLSVPAIPLQIGWGPDLPPGDPEFGRTVLHVVSRLVTVAMTAGLVTVLFRLGVETIGRRGAVFACLFFIFSPTVVYYAKMSNVDMSYVFWVGLSLLFYGRAVLDNRLEDYLGLAATAAAAVCTKDQAYAFYALVPFALIVSNAVHRRRAGGRLTPIAVMLDRKFVLAALLAAVLFALFHNLPFNLEGFRAHLAQLDENTYRAAVDPTIAGTVRLFGLNLRVLAWMAGWPALVLTAIGLALVLRDARRHLLLLVLLVPVVSYAIFFLGVVRYSFDRFLLGVWVVLVLFAGKGAVALVEAGGRTRVWGRAAIAGALIWSALYGASVNAALTRDARYRVEQYLREEAEKLPMVGYFGLAEYLPRRQSASWRLMDPTLSAVCAERPEYVVYNNLWMTTRIAAQDEGRALAAALSDGGLGYRAVLRHTAPLPFWAVMRWWGLVPEGRESPRTFFSKVNATIVVLERVSADEPAVCRDVRSGR